MQCRPRLSRRSSPAAGRAPIGRRDVLRLAGGMLVAGLGGFGLPLPAEAALLVLREVRAQYGEDGVQLSFVADFTLPRVVEEALLKGVPLYFVAEAALYQSRWYWRDRRVAQAARQWRLAYQPLTRRYRVAFGSLVQNYASLPEALAAMQRTVHWRIADAQELRSAAGHYLELNYRLDISQLPRPFQIGVGGQAEWQLSAQRTLTFDDAPR